MRKRFSKFFCVPKNGKVSEKVMLVRVATTVAIVVMCLVAMSLSAFAYFSYNLTSGSNIIRAANFGIEVEIQEVQENGENSKIEVTDSKKHFSASLKAGKTYSITLTPAKSSTAKTGFVVVTIGDKTYHTQQLGIDGETKTDKITFRITTDTDTGVTFLACWGTSAYYDEYKNQGDDGELYITQGEEVILSSEGTAGSDSKKEETTAPNSGDETGGEPDATPATEGESTKSPETAAPEDKGTDESAGSDDKNTEDTDTFTAEEGE